MINTYYNKFINLYDNVQAKLTDDTIASFMCGCIYIIQGLRTITFDSQLYGHSQLNKNSTLMMTYVQVAGIIECRIFHSIPVFKN